MSSFNGSSQNSLLVGVTSSETVRVKFVLIDAYEDFTGTSRYLVDTREVTGAGWLGTASGSSAIFNSGVLAKLDGVGASSIDSTSGAIGVEIALEIDVSINDGTFTLFSKNDDTEYTKINTNLIEIWDNLDTTLLHSFDLSSPVSEVVSDSVGSATLTLSGFTFGPSIGDIDGDNDVFDNQSTTLNGSTLGSDGGTLLFDDVPQGVASNTATVANITIVQGHLNYGAHDAVWTDTLAVKSAPLSINISPIAGLQFVKALNPVSDDTSLFFGVSPAVVDNDQLETPLLTDQGKSITLNANGTFIIVGAGSTKQTFQYRIHDLSDDNWSNYAAVIINGVVISKTFTARRNNRTIKF